MRLALLCCVAALAACGPAAAHPGVGIVMDGRGNVFYTDLTQVWKIAPDGSKSVAVPGVHTHELCLDAAGSLFGEHLWYEGEKTDKWGHRVWRRAADGAIQDVIPATEGFLENYSFVRDRAGTMYFVERTPKVVFRKKVQGGPTAQLAACPDCRDVRWLTVTADGVVYFEDGVDLRRIDPTGSVHTIARGLGERVLTQSLVSDKHLLMGLWTDPSGNVYVSSYGSREVKRVAPDGAVEIVATARFPWSPTGGLIAPNGDLWLLECSTTNAVRVRRIDHSGKVKVY